MQRVCANVRPNNRRFPWIDALLYLFSIKNMTSYWGRPLYFALQGKNLAIEGGAEYAGSTDS